MLVSALCDLQGATILLQSEDGGHHMWGDNVGQFQRLVSVHSN